MPIDEIISTLPALLCPSVLMDKKGLTLAWKMSEDMSRIISMSLAVTVMSIDYAGHSITVSPQNIVRFLKKFGANEQDVQQGIERLDLWNSPGMEAGPGLKRKPSCHWNDEESIHITEQDSAVRKTIRTDNGESATAITAITIKLGQFAFHPGRQIKSAGSTGYSRPSATKCLK